MRGGEALLRPMIVRVLTDTRRFPIERKQKCKNNKTARLGGVQHRCRNHQPTALRRHMSSAKSRALALWGLWHGFLGTTQVMLCLCGQGVNANGQDMPTR